MRFVLEAGFLIALAVAAGLAELSPTTIVLVMGAAWLLVAIIEWLAWRESPRMIRVVREQSVPAAAQAPRPEPEPEPEPEEDEPADSGLDPAAEVDEAETGVIARRRFLRRKQRSTAAPEPEPELEPVPKHVRVLPQPETAVAEADLPPWERGFDDTEERRP